MRPLSAWSSQVLAAVRAHPGATAADLAEVIHPGVTRGPDRARALRSVYNALDGLRYRGLVTGTNGGPDRRFTAR